MAEAKVAPPALDDVRKYLTDNGAKAEDLEKLDEAALRAKYDEAKTSEGKPEPAKPEDFEIKIPEGVKLDDKLVGDFKAILADAKLSPAERAQKLVDMHLSDVKASQDASMKLWYDTQVKWQGDWKADAELGGANFEQVSATIAKAIDEVGGKDAQAIRDALMFTGAGNNVPIGRLVYRMAKALVEGGHVSGESPAKLGEGQDAVLMALYPTAAKAR